MGANQSIGQKGICTRGREAWHLWGILIVPLFALLG